MINRSRLIGGMVLALLAALALSGCVKFDMNVTVNADDTVSGTLVIAFDKQVLAELGGGADPLGGDPVAGVSKKEPYDDGTYQGVTYTFENTPLAEFNATDDSGGDYIRIRHEGENYVLTGVIDQTYTLPSDGPIDTAVVEALKRADMRVTVHFPGAVISTDGELQADGRSVTWKLTPGEKTELNATAGPAGNVTLALWVLWIMLAAVVIVAVLLFLQLRRVSLRA